MDFSVLGDLDTVSEVIERAKRGRVLALYFIGSTKTSTIPGLSVAGATPDLTLFTPACDVEYLVYGEPRSFNAIPVTPEGIPTPAVITRSCLNICQIPYVVVDAGSAVEPKIPHVRLPSRTVGESIRTGKALPYEVAKALYEESKTLAHTLRGADVYLLGESIPGGTTTALGVLVALGYDAWGKVSSASPSNPHRLKEVVVREGLERSGLRVDEARHDPLRAVSALGDPVHVSMAGFLDGALRNKAKVVLAGGTQMSSVLAIAKHMNVELRGVTVATTKWIAYDPSSNIFALVRSVDPSVPIVSMDLDFSASPYKGLRYYEEGYVKEGVGAGGTAFLAHVLTGKSAREIQESIYKEYGRLIKSKGLKAL
ncbi:MAG: TIGR00303 family protein [Thaumarchaeota archaeon]|nr:TIGR00303 family protein [Nitrososphaerota archaeon]